MTIDLASDGVADVAQNSGEARWRRIEWFGACVSLFLTTGAIFPLLMADETGALSEAARGKLRLLMLPIFGFSLLLISRHLGQLRIALRRTLPFSLFVGLAFVSVLWSVSPGDTLRRSVALLFTILLAYVLAIRFTPRQLMHMVAVVFGAILVASLLMAVLAPDLAYMPEGNGMRGVYIHKNVLGWAACTGVLAAVALILEPVGEGRLRGIALLAVSGPVLLMSQSATSLLAAALGVVLFGFYGMLRRARGLARAMLVFGLLQLVALLLIGLGEFLVPFLESLGKDATLTGRVPLWEYVDPKIADRLVLGWGYQAFWLPDNPEALWIWSQIGWAAPHAHSGFREVLLNFGIVGLLVLGFVVIGAIRRGAAMHCQAPGDGWNWINVMIGAILVLNLSESLFLVQGEPMWLLMSTAIIMVALRYPEARDRRR